MQLNCSKALRQMKIFVFLLQQYQSLVSSQSPVSLQSVSSSVQALLARSNQRLIITINTTAEVRPMFLVVMMYGILSRVQTTNHITKGLLRLFVIPADLGANLSMEPRAVGVMLL